MNSINKALITSLHRVQKLPQTKPNLDLKGHENRLQQFRKRAEPQITGNLFQILKLIVLQAPCLCSSEFLGCSVKAASDTLPSLICSKSVYTVVSYAQTRPWNKTDSAAGGFKASRFLRKSIFPKKNKNKKSQQPQQQASSPNPPPLSCF